MLDNDDKAALAQLGGYFLLALLACLAIVVVALVLGFAIHLFYWAVGV